MKSPVRIATVLIGAVVALTGVVAASAHDVHPFGSVTVALGWLHEPAYVGFDNAVQVLVKDSAGNAITDITDKDLTVELIVGNQKSGDKPLVPTADPDTGLGLAGEYEYHVIPTVPGAYTFHLKGKVKGQAIDEMVTAGDKTFNLVTNASEAQFPNQLPSSTELSTKLEKVSARQETTQSTADSAKALATPALIVAIAGVVLALALGGGALLVARRGS